MIKIYHKTATIKAEQFDGSREMADKYHIEWDEAYVTPFRIETMEGWVGLGVGDWIAIGVNGEHRPISDDIFKESYEELPVIPKFVADWIEECKNNGISIANSLCSDRRPEKVREWMEYTPGKYKIDLERYNKYQELVAKSWIEGYQVEE